MAPAAAKRPLQRSSSSAASTRAHSAPAAPAAAVRIMLKSHVDAPARVHVLYAAPLQPRRPCDPAPVLNESFGTAAAACSSSTLSSCSSADCAATVASSATTLTLPVGLDAECVREVETMLPPQSTQSVTISSYVGAHFDKPLVVLGVYCVVGWEQVFVDSIPADVAALSVEVFPPSRQATAANCDEFGAVRPYSFRLRTAYRAPLTLADELAAAESGAAAGQDDDATVVCLLDCSHVHGGHPAVLRIVETPAKIAAPTSAGSPQPRTAESAAAAQAAPAAVTRSSRTASLGEASVAAQVARSNAPRGCAVRQLSLPKKRGPVAPTSACAARGSSLPALAAVAAARASTSSPGPTSAASKAALQLPRLGHHAPVHAELRPS